MEWTPSQKGAIAETAITAAATELGVPVLRPVNDGGRYDLVFDVEGRLLRIQCKWASLKTDVIVVRARTCRYGPSGKCVRTVYSPAEIDAIAAYCPQLRRCFLVPAGHLAGRGHLHLRLSPARNNQVELVNFASDYDLGTMLERLGAVVQLGERLHGMQEAAGSSPASSTRDADEAAPPRGLFAV